MRQMSMVKHGFMTAITAGFMLSACGAPNVFELIPEEVTSRNMAPPGAAPGTCWGRDATPAVIETVTEQAILKDADAPVYQTETSQQIITPREDTWFETPCEDVMTPEFTASVQRALQARGHYQGGITGRMDGRTQAAIRAYQKPQGLDSGMLSLAAARQMGLLQVDLEDAGIDVSDVTVADLNGTDVQVTPIPETKPVTETAAAAAARLAEEQAAARLATLELEKQAEEDAVKQATLRAEEEKRAAEAARLAQQEAVEAARIAEAKAAEEAKQAAERAAQDAADREKNKRAKELAQALEEEKERTGGTVFEPLPISSESY
ncbi:MAG: peptidoglycan-binding domain-containing protein [Pseudomonadota bacterium]